MSAAQVIALADPPVRIDGLCAWCLGERTPPKKLHRLQALADPFCSSDCCRQWYGLGSEDHSERRGPFRKRAYV